MRELTVESSRPRKRPGVTARLRARKRRKEAPVVTRVRARCVDRDGYCRLMGVSPCAGPSQWCHLGDKQRFKTRGQAPEVRHTVEGTFMGCEKHHGEYDRGELEIIEGTTDGAEGPLIVNGEFYV